MEIRVTPILELHPPDEENNYFGIYRCIVNSEDAHLVKINRYNNISFKGVTPKLNLQEEYKVVLKEDTQSRYEGSYILESITKERPKTLKDQKIFLSSILTPTQVANIYNFYSEEDDVVGLIENGEFEYVNVKGFGKYMYEKLQEKVKANIDMSEILTFLSKYDIKYSMIAKLVKEYKNPQIVINKIESNPYVLTEVKGIGFIKADEIAKAVGFDMDSPLRINSCLIHCIKEETKNGHSWMEYKQLFNKAINYLNIEPVLINDAIASNPKGLLNINERYTTETIYNAESFVAMSVTKFKTQSKKVFETEEVDKFLDNYCEKHGIDLEAGQRRFFHDWNENAILALIGGGGTGKSYIQKILLELISTKNLTTALLAPTGKASKVMAKYTGKSSSTIHRRVGVVDSETDFDLERVISEDVILVDEASMCDIFILAKLFKAITNNNARVMFIGDDFQLPSVGVGNFLYDIINSNCVKISELTKVYRQDDDGILDIVTDTRHGQKFLNGNEDGRVVFGRDCVFWFTHQDYILDGVLHNYKKVLQKFNPDEIVVLSPTNKGKLGTVALNKKLQEIVNPKSPRKKEKEFGKLEKTIFRVGDSVINTTNIYGIKTVEGAKVNIYNGDSGKIVDIDELEKVIIVEIEGMKIKMKFLEALKNLLHSWATSIHRSQGSQYEVVIVISDKSAVYQLNANLLYTAWSRATKYLLNLGQADVINRALSKFANMERRSFMQELLVDYNSESFLGEMTEKEILERLTSITNNNKIDID